MNARPEFLALKEFGTLRSDMNEAGWWLLPGISSCLSDEETHLLVHALAPARQGLSGVTFCFLDPIRDSPGLPGHALSLNLPDDSVWNARLMNSAQGLAP